MLFSCGFLRSIINFYFFKKIVFFIIYNDRKSKTCTKKIYKIIRNFFRLKNKLNYNAIKYKKKLNELKTGNEKCFSKKKKNYYKPVRVRINKFSNNHYIEYESNGDRNKTLLVEGHLDKIRPYLKDIINNLKKSDK